MRRRRCLLSPMRTPAPPARITVQAPCRRLHKNSPCPPRSGGHVQRRRAWLPPCTRRRIPLFRRRSYFYRLTSTVASSGCIKFPATYSPETSLVPSAGVDKVFHELPRGRHSHAALLHRGCPVQAEAAAAVE